MNIDISNIDYDTLDNKCFHITRKENENNIFKEGLKPQIGTNSKGILGKEKTHKVFFTKGVKGTLEYINRTVNIAKYIIDKDEYYKIIPEQYKKFFPDKIINKSKEEVLEYFILKYFEDSTYLLLNLEEGKDYLEVDLNEESNKVGKQDYSNMHTISNVGVAKEKVEKIHIKKDDSVINFICFLTEKYKKHNHTENLPCKGYDENLIENIIKNYNKDELER